MTDQTVAFELDGEELDFYDELTRFVEDQSILAAMDESAHGASEPKLHVVRDPGMEVGDGGGALSCFAERDSGSIAAIG